MREFKTLSVAAFWLSKNQLAILDVIQPQFQHLANTHPTPGQQLENQPVPGFNRSENDLVNGLFFDDFPSGNHSFPVQFPDHGRIARITHAGIDVIAEKIEKGRQVGITDSFGAGFVTVGKVVQKGKDVFRCNLFNLGFTQILAEPVNDGLIRSNGIFFSNGFCGKRSRL
ncbi:MAG: hypothetical protein R6V60_11190 [Desulfobacterales bacterium]